MVWEYHPPARRPRHLTIRCEPQLRQWTADDEERLRASFSQLAKVIRYQMFVRYGVTDMQDLPESAP